MCEFCTRHGEGKKWYENITNYSEELFHQINSEENLKAFLKGFYYSLKVDVEKAHRWKRRFPRIYRLIARPIISRQQKKTHFGQILPLEDVENILDRTTTIVRLPCICRKVTTGKERRYCFGIGMDLTPVMKDVPDFSEFERLSREEAKEFIRHLDTEGNTHSVWTFNTPFIGALCNCDRDCMAWRFQLKMDLGRVMWKGEYVAEIDPERCTGCRECIKRCYFRALHYDGRSEKCSVDLKNCYGCGICRGACKDDAITLRERAEIPAAAELW